MGFSKGNTVQIPAPAEEEPWEEGGEFLKQLRKLHIGEPVADENVALDKLELYSRPLSSLASGSSSSESSGDGIKKISVKVLMHDFFVITLKSGERYLGEKVRKTTTCGVFRGTKVNFMECKIDLKDAKHRGTVDLKTFPKVKVRDLYRALISGAREYSLFSLNCWDYGHEKPKEVILLVLKESSDMPEASKDDLQEKIKYVKNLERPRPRDAFRVVYKPCDPRNEETLNKLDNRCKGKKYGIEAVVSNFHKVHRWVFKYKESSQDGTQQAASDGTQKMSGHVCDSV